MDKVRLDVKRRSTVVIEREVMMGKKLNQKFSDLCI